MQRKTYTDRTGIIKYELWFSDTELEVLEKVASVFKSISTNHIIELSHLEKAWKKNKKTKNVISYEYAFELNQI